MNIRHSTEQDFCRMMEIYSFARKYMAEHGNPNQWGPTNWPPEALIHSDIRDGNSYVCVNDAGKVIGTFFFIYGKDIEPTYRNITDGTWLDDSPYGVVHRIAGDGSEKGIGAFCIADILVEDWKTAYRGIIDSDYLDSMNVEERYQREVQRYQIYRVAESGKEVLGFTWNEITDGEAEDCEIIAIYIRYAKRKGGIGRVLFQDSVNLFRAVGRKRMIIWCLRDNAEARKFYEKMGGTVYKTGVHQWGRFFHDNQESRKLVRQAKGRRSKLVETQPGMSRRCSLEPEGSGRDAAGRSACVIHCREKP